MVDAEHLAEKHFLRRSLSRPPQLETPLQGADLPIRELARLFALQPLEESFGLQPTIAAQQLFDLRPDLLKRV